MKKIKKLFYVLVLTLVMAFGFAGCTGGTNGGTVSGSVSERYVAKFETLVEETQDLSTIADKLLSAKLSNYASKQNSVNKGYLLGFSAKSVENFDEAVCISAKTSSTPFIAYLFKSSDMESLKATLDKTVDLGFQICVFADESASSLKNGVLFYIICPSK